MMHTFSVLVAIALVTGIIALLAGRDWMAPLAAGIVTAILVVALQLLR